MKTINDYYVLEKSCEYCKYEVNEYTGKNLKLLDVIDGKRQSFKSYIFDDPEIESFIIFVSGAHSQFSIKINFCPFCGEKL